MKDEQIEKWLMDKTNYSGTDQKEFFLKAL